MTIRKRTYSLIVESIENIWKYSALKSSQILTCNLKLLSEMMENKLLFLPAIPFRKAKKEILVQKLDYVNSLESLPLLRNYMRQG